jgi:hypothetical protein
LNDQDNKGEVILDLARENRTGLAEAVFCNGKSQSQLETICNQVDADKRSMLFTRFDSSQFSFLDQKFPGLINYDPVSQTGISHPREMKSDTHVAVITGGSSDVPVAREATKTLEYYGQPALVIDDVGVAGLWRLVDRVKDIEQMKVAICIAGMDAALPTVLGGLIPCSIIAVPTSVGYGMAKNGETALRSLLVSCAPGLTVVNIDNGYGAACAAIRLLNQLNDEVM